MARTVSGLLLPLLFGVGFPEISSGQDVTPTNIWTDFFSNRVYLNGARAAIGDTVEAYDPDGVLCGVFTVQTTGAYGYLHVYGDEVETPEDEGAVEGDTISFKIDGEEAIAIGDVVWLSGNPGGVFQVDLYVGGFPPIIENFPAEISFLEEKSAQIALNDYVFDQNNAPEELSWTGKAVSGIPISLGIDPETQVATLSTEPNVTGVATVQFEVTDPEGFSDSVQVSVVVVNVDNDPPSSFALISPAHGDTVESLTITFLWHRSIDPESDSIEYIVHLSGSGMDTTVVGVFDTSLIFEGGNSLQYEAVYTWYVEATDSMDTTSSATEHEFWTPKSVTIHSGSETPDQFLLSKNYPNPFNPSTTIEFNLPFAARVRLVIYDLSGREVIRLVDGKKRAGRHYITWSGRDHDGEYVASGVYIYRLSAISNGVSGGMGGKDPLAVSRRLLLLK